jgi:hypothetical protein
MVGSIKTVMESRMLVRLNEASEWFPKRNGKPLGSSALRRRIHTGKRGVRLQAVRDGGEWFTCREWVEEFMAAVTAASLKKPPQRRKGTSPHAKRILARYGINAS